MISSFLWSMAIYCIICLPIYLIFRYIYMRKREKHWLREGIMLLFFLYCVSIFSQTIIPNFYFVNGRIVLDTATTFSRSNFTPLNTILLFYLTIIILRIRHKTLQQTKPMTIAIAFNSTSSTSILRPIKYCVHSMNTGMENATTCMITHPRNFGHNIGMKKPKGMNSRYNSPIIYCCDNHKEHTNNCCY